MKALLDIDNRLMGSLRFMAAVAVLIALTVSPVMAGETPEVIVGAEIVGGPVTPVTAHVDIFSIEPPPQWRPGDPIKEIPRRFFGGSKAPVDPSIGLPDPLVDVQRSAPLNNDRVFTTPIANFDGQGFTGVSPPDTVGDVGPTYYIQSINGSGGSLVQIYDKTGATVGSAFSMDTLGSGSCGSGYGDPIVLYDRLAERWMLQEFSSGGNYLCFYISDTPDPTEGTWHAYAFQAPNFPDYPHIGVWPDAYYTTTNEENGGAIYAFDRENMLTGGTARALQRFSLASLNGYGFQAPTPADLDGADAPPAGAPGYIMRHVDDEAHSNYPDDAVNDLLEIFAFDVDFDNAGNTSLTQLPDVVITDYNSWMIDYSTFYSVPQPGTSTRLDPIREVILNRLIYRNFGDHETLAGVFPTNINEATSGSAVNAGQRWFELRKVGAGDWTLHQEGTYQPGDDSENRFVGSLAMDQSGNMALAYSFTDLDPAADPSLKFTGRLKDDPLDAMSQAETNLVAGSGSGGGRWGDYASMNVDPADDCTFWFTGEYTSGNWATRVASFKFEACGCELVLDAPTVSVAVQGVNIIRVQWNDSTVPEMSEYRVYRATVTGGPYDLMATVADTSPGSGGGAGYSWDDTTVSGGITYYYMVRSSDGSACVSDPSNEASAEATGVCLLAPDFAGVIDVSNPGEELCSLDVAWSAGTSLCGGSLSYSVYRSTTSGFTPDLANQVADGVVGSSFPDADNLIYGERYYYIVRATDTGNSVTEDNVVAAAAKPTGVITVSDWNDDVEAYATIADAVVDGWNHGADAGSDDWSVATGDDHTTGSGNAFRSFDVGDVTDKWLQTDAIGVIVSTELSFWHKFQFEGGYDGGVLEISVDAGASWQDLEDHITSGVYNDSISTGWSNPIGGQNAWSGDQLSFGQVVVDLSAFDGQTVMIRWRMGCDSSLSDGPWLIDDVLVTDAGVAGPCSSGEPMLFGDGFESGGTTLWSVTRP